MCAANNCLGQTKEEVYREFTLELEANERFFFKEGLYPGQKRNYLSLAVHPEYSLEWKDGKHSLNFTGFLRLDQYDKKRNHWDIRELYWQSVFKNTEFSIGAKKVFWGKTESAHLVDIINQTDVVESFDGEQKLGEVMVHLSQSVSIRASKEKVFDALTKKLINGGAR
ncbi:MAG: hypothetical protein O7F74_06805 [Bacteroidetes bacterium]|nr:hypothetical protein [Bacteroidota bacterium]